MQDPEWSLNSVVKRDDTDDPPRSKSREELSNRLAIKGSLLVLGLALCLAAAWLIDSPSFEKCSALENSTERHACYEQLRSELLKPPVK